MLNTGKLYIAATPIGNLSDITTRVLEVLKDVDYVLCEDSRVTKKLLHKFDIPAKTISYHQHSKEGKIQKIRELIKDGKDLALVTDAGTPGISDPGNYLISELIKGIPELEVISVPGPSAVIAGLSISGFPTDKFLFLGFPPHKKGRNKFFKELSESKHTVAIYESTHRIKKTLKNLSEVLDPDNQVCVARELTKKFESIYRGTISEINEMDIPEKGEFVVIIK